MCPRRIGECSETFPLTLRKYINTDSISALSCRVGVVSCSVSCRCLVVSYRVGFVSCSVSCRVRCRVVFGVVSCRFLGKRYSKLEPARAMTSMAQVGQKLELQIRANSSQVDSKRYPSWTKFKTWLELARVGEPFGRGLSQFKTFSLKL